MGGTEKPANRVSQGGMEDQGETEEPAHKGSQESQGTTQEEGHHQQGHQEEHPQQPKRQGH
jgi:hypothetical protein